MVLSVERLGGIRVRDDSEGSSLVDFIEKFLSGHSKFLIYVHGYAAIATVLWKNGRYFTRPAALMEIYLNVTISATTGL